MDSKGFGNSVYYVLTFEIDIFSVLSAYKLYYSMKSGNILLTYLKAFL